MATQDLMSKIPGNAAPAPRPTSQPERRGTRRCKITQLMRIRPSDPEHENFEDLRGSMSVSRSGVYFQTSEKGYKIGDRKSTRLNSSHLVISYAVFCLKQK